MNSDGSNFSDDDVPSDNSRAETSRAGRSRARNASVAKNAFRVPKYHKKRKDVVEESSGEEFDFTGVDLTHTRKSSKAKGKEKEKTPEADGRVRKRRKVAHDLSFLETASVHPTAPAHPSPFAVPSAVTIFRVLLFPLDNISQDLLKCIHHFACNYYSERGQLFYTYYKDKRRAAKSAAQKKTKTNDADGQEDASEAETESTQKKKRGGDKQRGMYKTLDGSALLAIGMLLQERVARLLTPRVPDGWEEGTLDDSDEEMEVDEDGNDPGTEHQDPDDEEEDEDEGSEDNDADKAEAEYDEGNDEKDVDDEKDEDENGEGKDEDEKDEDEDEDEDGKDADEKYDDEEDTSAQGGSNPDAESENDPDDPPGKSGAPLPGDSNEEDGNEEEE
ncbi:hypothetical protein B0H16DRAFT_1719938 [Mycena metata]|uniref:Uncharacterized protein n=1 Tax=Mycena metata TaxID=1033252 RepID=A0AAD7NH06_9AGAR|nr:hypothetical protein B0H16DRAFT_1719938 [Mycena metata]